MINARTELVFSALADPTRRRIVELLSRSGELRVMDIAEEFDATRQATTKHLDILCKAGITQTLRRGRERYSALSEDAFDPMRDWLRHYDRFWEQKLGDLKALIERKEKE